MSHTHYVDGKVSGRDFRRVTTILLGNSIHIKEWLYGFILSNVVVACVDVVISFRGKLLLGFRLNEPSRENWAFPGGRMMPGESFGDTARRHIQKNLGLKMSPKRFRVVRTDSWAWSRRAQEPQEKGCHMVGIIAFAKISAKEARRIRSCDDLNQVRWMDIDSILKDKRVHPAHRAAARNIQNSEFQPD